MLSTVPAQAQRADVKSVGKFAEFSGRLADGTPYVLRKPANWNGIVLRDLDGVLAKDSEFYKLLLKSGYGLAGVTRRSPDRAWTLNRWDDMQRPQQALKLFEARFGKPKLAIAFGRSAGGSSTMLTSERHPDTVDGGVALCSTMDIIGYSGYNLIFDFFFTLKALIAPNDDRALTHALPTGDPTPHQEYWRRLLDNAAATPEGRARIALAFTLAQFPLFTPGPDKVRRRPDFNDPKSVVDAVIADIPQYVVRLGLLTVHGAKDFPADLEIPGTPVSNPLGNDGAIYADYWTGADPNYKRAVQAIYADAKLDLAADVRSIDAAPRVSLDRDNMRRGVLARGLPTMPLFRMDNLGDVVAPPSMSKLYDKLVATNGLGDLYRTSYVDNSGHCAFKPQQVLAAVEVMRERLQTGKWPATDAAALNARAGVNDGDGIVFVEQNSDTHAPTWRVESSTDLFQPATFATTEALVRGYQTSLTPAQRAQLLTHLSTAERATQGGQADGANEALNHFSTVANGVTDRIARTRLSTAAYKLRAKR